MNCTKYDPKIVITFDDIDEFYSIYHAAKAYLNEHKPSRKERFKALGINLLDSEE